jgi:hypothetical protein
MEWFFSKPKPKADTGRVLNALDLMGAGATAPAGDVGYAEVNSAWLAGYYDSFRNSLFREGVVKWDVRFDCNHFADTYAALAQLRFFVESFQSRTAAQTLAIGVVWYRPDKGGGHAINCALTERGLIYIEPQTGAEVTLSESEIASRFLVRF